jgi:hypothetical protein
MCAGLLRFEDDLTQQSRSASASASRRCRSRASCAAGMKKLRTAPEESALPLAELAAG